MSRPLRIEFPGAIYHITSRGNASGLIFIEDNDRKLFLDIMADVIKRYNWICHSYCLMSNHYHLLIETVEANLSSGMRQLNGVYTMWFNKIHNRVGHIFQGRYKSIIIDRENYLLTVCRYVVLNPVRAKMVDRPENYIWSSYCAIAGLKKSPDFLTIGWILKHFEDQPASARVKYSEFVYAGMNGVSPWDSLRGQIILGKEKFCQTIEKMIGEKVNIPEISRAQRHFIIPPTAEQLTIAKKISSLQKRNEIIHGLHYKNGMAINKIAKLYSLHTSTISRIINCTV
ncbi:MAG: transposase [Gammaproteobacteria bacterium]|nr:transposase [Gammaproteobacteria bacterium]